MKRSLSLILAAIIIAAALASCAVSPSVDAHIRVTSSDAVDAAAWLAERLGESLTDSVVIGTDAADYGVSVETLEADGFFIRSFGREDVLLAKTPDGLDRAVRKYAKMVEAGEPRRITRDIASKRFASAASTRANTRSPSRARTNISANGSRQTPPRPLPSL